MTKLTDKQAKWLQKASDNYIVYVAKFDGLLYVAGTTAHRLHAIPVEDLEPGQYDLFGAELIAIAKGYSPYNQWPRVVPIKYEVKQIIVPEKLKDLKAKANEYNAICVNEQLDIWLDYRSYYDATHYNGECEMRILDHKHGVRFNYSDGSLAMVGPMNAEKMR